MSKDRSSYRPPAMPCPYCKSIATIRTSRAVTATYREIRYLCCNEECGAIFAASLTVTHIMVPSAMPGARVDVPLIVRGWTRAPANDDRLPTPTPANDDLMSETG